MAFVPKAQAFSAHINAVTLGTGDKSIVIGGENVLPFYTFDAPMDNKPQIGIEISDLGLENYQAPGFKALYEGCNTMAEMAKKAETVEGASFICLYFEGADPNGHNKSVEECVAQAKEVAAVVTKPLVIMGCKNTEKDTALLGAMAEALQGKNALFLSAREEDYKSIGASVAMAYGQKVGAESAVDINLAKQLNVLITQMGVDGHNVAMNVGSAAAGYGFEYVVSTLERVKAAALSQNDATLQMPIITPVGVETWGVKEATAPESDVPEWGCQEERGIDMEVETAAACLAYGSDAVILKHPESIKTVAQLIAALM